MSPNRAVLLPLVAALFGVLPVSHSPAQTASDKATVQGKFLGDGKDAKIQHVLALTTEPFSGKPAIKLIFTEKNPSASKNPGFDAGFKKLGSALVLSVFQDGDIFGCEVAHTAHPKSPFSSLGSIKIENFKVADNQASGHVTTGGEKDAFGQKWEVDLTFSAPLPKGAFATAAAEPASGSKKPAKEMAEKPATPAGPKPPIADLPLPASARDVEYKSVVEQIAFSADASVSAVSKDFSSKLSEKGWKEASGSLNGKNNAILRRKLNDAELTIMIQPAGKGSTVKVFAKGLDWSNPPASAPAQPAKSGDTKDAGSEAKRLIDDALKQIPRGLIK